MKSVNQYVMKDSGVQWIGQVPKHWEVCRLGTIFKENVILNTEKREVNALQFKLGEIISKSKGNSKYIPISLSGYNIVEPNVIMINGLNLSFDFISQRVALVKERGVITSTYIAIAPSSCVEDKNTTSRYVCYLLKAYDACKVLHAMGRGLRAILSYSVLSKIPIYLPPLSEQRAIADWLDAKCADIDAAIELQQRMIDKLKAYKTAVIHQAVTKGLDKNANLKDSGVQWIGEIPKHWDVCQIKQVCRIFGRIGYRGYTQDDLVDAGEGAITLSPSNMQNGKMNFNKCNYLTWKKYYESPEIMINDGDILFVKTGSTYGKTSIVENLPMEATINPQIVVLKEIKMNNYFLYYLLLTEIVQGQVSCSVGGSTIPTLSQESISNYVIPLPPLSEQRAIADWLDAKCADIDATIALKEQKQEKLKEYKKTIIFEYVTGKKQVANINK